MGLVDSTIAGLAERSHGVLHHRDLIAAGVSLSQINHRLETGHLIRLHRGVYRVAGSALTYAQSLMAAVLFGGPGSAVSHRAAAGLHGLLGVGQPIEICTPRSLRTQELPSDWVVHTSVVLTRSDLTTVDRVPTTTVERTLIDLGAVQPARRVAHALDTAIRESKTDLALLKYVHARRRGRGRRGAGVLATVLETHALTGAAESPYERRLVDAILEIGARLPRLQHDVSDNGFRARLDLAWVEERVAVEVDGHAYHSTREQRSNDAVRQNRLARLGWTVLRFTTDQIAEDVHAVVREILLTLRSCRG